MRLRYTTFFVTTFYLCHLLPHSHADQWFTVGDQLVHHTSINKTFYNAIQHCRDIGEDILFTTKYNSTDEVKNIIGWLGGMGVNEVATTEEFAAERDSSFQLADSNASTSCVVMNTKRQNFTYFRSTDCNTRGPVVCELNANIIFLELQVEQSDKQIHYFTNVDEMKTAVYIDSKAVSVEWKENKTSKWRATNGGPVVRHFSMSYTRMCAGKIDVFVNGTTMNISRNATMSIPKCADDRNTGLLHQHSQQSHADTSFVHLILAILILVILIVAVIFGVLTCRIKKPPMKILQRRSPSTTTTSAVKDVVYLGELGQGTVPVGRDNMGCNAYPPGQRPI